MKPSMFAEIKWTRFCTPFLVLAGLDLLLISTNVVFRGLSFFDVIESTPNIWKVTSNVSISSGFIFFKWIALSTILVLIWRRDRQPIYAVLAAVFLALFLDDLLEIHEFVGITFATQFDLPEVIGLRGQDLGELMYWAMLGTAVLSGTIFGLYASTPVARLFGYAFLVLFLFLAFFGIFVDLLHVVAQEIPGDLGKVVGFGFGLFEDGGEMIAASALTAFAYSLWRHPKNS
ncbi:hypothetical protein AB9F29_20245 [Falsihalocynthiibacter sp. S25ZX9]|uniref:hypothetical protein n=1 Tax=Falsihalocynthiibacter sp. S25ZX9 TaxID=3240870 RepID=UPI00350F272E